VSWLSVNRGHGPQPQPGGSWMSGPCINATRPSAPLPQFNPSALALAVQRLLGERGITVIVDLGNANMVVTAAADLLRAMGVAPDGQAR
jgi:hypothetical protein